jgi:hypothetical protein
VQVVDTVLPLEDPGARREAPIILTVDAAAMHAADHVPPGYLSGWPG